MNTDAERRELRARMRALAQAGDLDGMQQLLGKTPEQKAAEQAALCKAARDKNLAEVAALLAAGVNPDGSKGAKTPLQEALDKNYEQETHLPLVRALLEAGANPDPPPPSERFLSEWDKLTLFQMALAHGARETARLLLDHGADIHRRNGDRKTALLRAAEQAVEDDDLTLLTWLLEAGADPNVAEYHFDDTPLTIAAEHNRVGLIDYLVQAGADVRKGHPLVTAADRGRLEAAQRLLELGADVNEVDISENTGLICAIIHHNTAMARLLIDHGAPLDKPTETYKGEITPLEFARDDPQYNADIIAYMLAHIAAYDAERALQESGRYYAAGLVKVARDPRQGQPIAEWLTQGAHPNATNEYERTALHYVVERGKAVDDARLLLEAGADVNARDPFGYTPLHDSVLGDNAEIIQLLLDAGADPAARVERGIHHGLTALDIARIERKENAIHLLTPLSPEPRPLTPCEPEFRKDGSVKGFSHIHYEEDAAKNELAKAGQSGHHIYMHQTGTKRHWVEKGRRQEYTEPCVRTIDYDIRSQYRGTGIPRAEHPLRWRMAMDACLHCGSEEVLVIYADWGVQPHSGDAHWNYTVKCSACGYYSSWGYSDG